jgi:hypothetical protein
LIALCWIEDFVSFHLVLNALKYWRFNVILHSISINFKDYNLAHS